MRRYHRILAMLLAIVTVWTILPMSVFADTWVEVETEKESVGDASSTVITLSVDPEALISYLKSGDKSAILSGIDLSGLRDVLDKDALLAIFPEEEIREIADIVFEDLDIDTLMKYLDVDALLESADTDALIEQIKNLPDLQNYVLDYDKLMSYLDDADLLNALDYVDTDALTRAHVGELVDLALELDAETLASLVDIAEVVEVSHIDFSAVLNRDFIEQTVGYDRLFHTYVDEAAMLDYLHERFHDVKHELHNYIIEEELEKFIAVHASELIPYLDFEKLQDMMAGHISEFAQLKSYLNMPVLYDLVRDLPYSSVDPYVNEQLAKKLVIDNELIDPKKLVSYIDVGSSSLDMDGLLNSNLITDSVIDALFDGGAIDPDGSVNVTLAKEIIIGQDLIAAVDLLDYIDLYQTDIDIDALMNDTSVVTDGVRDALIDGGAIDVGGNVDVALAKKLILDNNLIEEEALLPYFVLGDSAIDMQGLMASSLITAEIYRALEAGGAVVLSECVDFALAKQLILDNDLIKLEALVDYVDLDTCVIDMTGVMTDTTLVTNSVYEALINGGAIDAKAMVTSDTPLFSLNALHAAGGVDVAKMITGDNQLFDVWELEDREVIDFETVLVGDAAAGLPGLNPDWLVKEFKVFDLRDMLSKTEEHDALFTIEELAAEEIILLEELADDYGYANIVDENALKNQIVKLEDKSILLDCILDPAQVVRTVGIKRALEATGESYASIIEKYVADRGAFFNAIGVDSILTEITKNGDLEKIFDIRGLINSIGIDALLEIVDLKAVIQQLIDSGAIKDILRAIDPNTYLTVLTYTMGVLEKNIYEISLNGTVITRKDGTLLFIDTAVLVDTLLDELLPELDDVIEMGDDGVLFSTSLSVTYASESTDGAKKTKTVTLNAALASGVDRVRAAATKTKMLVERFLIQDFNDGILSLDFRLPSQFASALRISLEKLSTSGDPALEELKNEILDLYNANVNDVSAFLDSLTIEQAVALLKTVDASSFGKAYGRIITNQYVEILLAYVKDATGQDFTDLTPEDLLIKAGEIPTLSVLCDKIEAKLGREIGAFDRLPDREPAEILEKIAKRAGIDVDVKALLERAAAQEDPLAALYSEALALIEDAEGAYELISSRMINVLDKLLASKVGEQLSKLHLDDLYDGEGIFKYSKSIARDPMVYARRLAEKGVSLLGEKTSLPADVIEDAVNLLLSYFTEGDEVTLGIDITLRAENIYRIEFFETVDGKLVPIRTAFLPAGADLKAIQPYETDSLHLFAGWKDPTTGEIYEKMPEHDVQVVAELDDNVHYLYFYAWDSGKLLPNVIEVYDGETVESYLPQMNAIVRGYLGQQIPDKNIQWKNYPDQTVFDAWDAPITADLTFTWAHFYDVSLVNPASGEVAHTLTVPAGAVLSDPAYLSEMNDAVRLALGHPTLSDANIKWMIAGTAQEYKTDSKVNKDLSLSWNVSYRIKVMAATADGFAELQTLTVPHGKTLADYLAAVNEIARGKLDLTAQELPDANIEWYDCTDESKTSFDDARLNATVLEDGAISWKHFFNVSVVYPDTQEVVTTLRIPGGDGLKLYRATLNQIVKDALAQTHPALSDDNIVWLLEDGNKVDFDETAVNKPMTLTWALGYTVKLVWNDTPYKTLQLVDGENLWDYLGEMNAALRQHLNASAIKNENIEWYDYSDPAKTVLDEAALKKAVVSNLVLSSNCYYTFEVLDENGDAMDGLSFRVPYGSALSDAQISKIQGDVLKYINETLGLDYITAQDITYKTGENVFNSWNAVLDRNVTLNWIYAEYYQVDVYAPEALGGALVYTLNVLGGHKISDVDYALIRNKIRQTYYPTATDLPDGDIILIKLTGESFGAPTIEGDTSLTWRLAEYYDVEILYPDGETGNWITKTYVAREGNIFYTSWSEYANILALREEVAGPAPEDYEYIWLVVDADGNVTDTEFLEQTAITKDLRLTWQLRYNAVRYSISIVDPDDPETVLWSADGLKNKTHVITYLSEQTFGDGEQSVWAWLQALVAEKDPHIEDYVHEYSFSWRSYVGNGHSSVLNLEDCLLGSDLVLTWKYTRINENPTLGVVGAKPYTGNPEVDDYAILHEDGAWVIRMKDYWFQARPTEFLMTADFLENAIAADHALRFDATASDQQIVLSSALLAKLYAVAKVQGVDVSSVTLRYAPNDGASVFDFDSGVFFTLDFYLNGSENGQVLKLGDFGVETDPEAGILADVMITLPFEELVANGNGIKTFVCFEADGESGKRYEKYELVSYDLDAKTVSFYAPHFSSVAIVNQYKVGTTLPNAIQSGIPAELLEKLPVNEDIAFYPIDLSVEEYYPAGAQIPLREIVGKDDHLTKINITRTLVLNRSGDAVDALPVSGSYTMPAFPIDLQFEIAPKIYYVYYYVDGAMIESLTQAYTAYMIETAEEIAAIKAQILSLAPLGEGYSEADGWSWQGYDERSLGTADMYLTLVRSTSEEAVPERTVDVIYYAEDGTTVLRRVTYKLSALADPSALLTVADLLGPDTDATRSAYWVNVADGLRVPADYSAEAWLALLDASSEISLRVAYTYRSFVIYTDGNVKVTVGETETFLATRGTEVTVTLANVVAGKIPTVFVKTASGEILVKSVGEEPVSFTMPAEDVMISVVYTTEGVDYVDPDGNVQSGTKGEMKTLPEIVIEKGMSMDLTKIPAELILSGAVIDGDKLILTYQYALGENTDAQALLNALRAAITQIEYQSYFIINGMIFENAEDAMAYICEDAGFDGWSETVDKNLNFGSFEQATKEFCWIWVIVLAILLFLILIIVLLYVLYIKGILKPNLFLKGIVAIVSAFFALCMALARAWLAILRLFGVDEDRLVRRYPLLKKRGKRASLEESLDALKAADPSFAERESSIDVERISEKTATVVEELEIGDESEAEENKD